MERQKRLKYLDIARGIAMLCIIIGHLGNGIINRVVFTFHVPVFFMITGYFTTDKLSNKEFIKKKFRTLIVPYFITCLVIVLLATVIGLLKNGTEGAKYAFIDWCYASVYGAGDSYSEPFYIKAIGAIWFLWATFLGSIFLKLSVRMKEFIRLIFIIALFMLGYFSRRLFWFPFSIQAGCCATLFMYIGYIYKKIEPNLYNINSEFKKAWLIFALVVWAFFIKDFQSFWLVHCDIGRGIVDIWGSICACYVVIQISKGIDLKLNLLSKGLAYIGKYSLLMLCFHVIELNLFPWWSLTNKLCEYGMPSVLFLPFIIGGKFTVDISLTFFASRIRIVRKLFGLPE